jgi:hypothetical protein
VIQFDRRSRSPANAVIKSTDLDRQSKFSDRVDLSIELSERGREKSRSILRISVAEHKGKIDGNPVAKKLVNGEIFSHVC